MRIQSKTFYADLFSKTSSTAPETPPNMADIKPMAALPPALSSKAPAPGQAPREAATGKALALPVPVPVQVPVPEEEPVAAAAVLENRSA